MSQSDLFQEIKSGYRLDKLEVFNWGTFDGEIYSLNPKACTSLLTGENGSGKSTIVDGITTLLVPGRKRSYNLSSGSKKRERTEKTYLLGAYGNSRDEDDSAQTNYIRDGKGYSVLLAIFKNECDDKITLAQVFWFNSQKKVEKFFIVGQCSLGIKQDFAGATTPHEIKSKFKSVEQVTIHSSFDSYSVHFRQLFGIESEKALELFCQVVATKEILTIDGFIKNHMLSPYDVGDRVEELIANFDNLDSAYNAIAKAKKQLEILGPLCEDIDRYNRNLDNQKLLSQCISFIPFYEAKRNLEVLHANLSENEEELLVSENKSKSLLSEIKSLQEAIDRIQRNIDNDETGRQVKEIDSKIESKKETKLNRTKRYNKYAELSKSLDFPEKVSGDDFYKRRIKLREDKKGLEKQLEEVSSLKNDVSYKLGHVRKEGKEAFDEHQILSRKKSNIHPVSLKIREKICSELGIKETDLPFAGELMKVKESEKRWEGAIERLTHGFALRMLVEESNYKLVCEFVNSNHLNGKLTFSKVTADRGFEHTIDEEVDYVAYKIDIKPNTFFSKWLEGEIFKQFDYTCCETVQEINRERRAITPAGLIKRNKSLHEKNDRYRIDDKTKYILGWNNEEKLKLLRSRYLNLGKKEQKLDQELKNLENRNTAISEKRELINRICDDFDEFDEIDWEKTALEIADLKKEKNSLLKSSRNLEKMQKEIQAKRIEKGKKEELKENTTKKIGLLEGAIVNINKNIVKANELISDKEGGFNESFSNEFKKREKIFKPSSKLKESKEYIIGLVQHIKRSLNESLDKERKDQASISGKITANMGHFTKDFPEEATDLECKVEYCSSYVDLFNLIEREKLPEHEGRFKQLLQKNILTDLTSLQGLLEEGEDEVRRGIRQINDELKSINYTSNSYVKIQINKTRDSDIPEFKSRLRDCYGDAGGSSDPDLETSFIHIKRLIDEFKNSERWKVKVTDIRNWFNFSVDELFQEDNTSKNYYSDSTALSAGQKTKLALTILASAINYQYNLTGQGDRCFRFVVVDEVFAKSDEKNSRYALELFKRLDLQLMLVTPADKIRIAEAYLKSIHLVQNNELGNKSTIQEITIDEYNKIMATANTPSKESGQELLVQ